MDWDFWRSRTEDELSFWRHWVAQQGDKWPANFRTRIDPDRPFPEFLERPLLQMGWPRGKKVKVLDVGSGPMTLIGQRSQAFEIEVVAVDPLADEYNGILSEHGITPPQRVIKGFAESLDALFEHNTFDLVYCRNALDHSFDPLSGLIKMLHVVKNDHPVFLFFHPNEADGGGYAGLHQWNFRLDPMESGGAFVMNRHGESADVAQALARFAELVSFAPAGAAAKSTIEVRITKKADLNLTQLFLRP